MATWDELYRLHGPQPRDIDGAPEWVCHQDHDECESLADCIATMEADADELDQDAEDLHDQAYEKEDDARRLRLAIAKLGKPAAPITDALPVPMLEAVQLHG